MTLRLRLVLALVALVAAVQATGFAVLYFEYRHSEYSQLDSQLRALEGPVDQQLDYLHGERPTPSGVPPSPGDPDQSGGVGQPERNFSVPPGTFGEQFAASGQMIGNAYLFGYGTGSVAAPKLPSPLPTSGPGGRILTVKATRGSLEYRVFEQTRPDGDTTVVAVPTTEVVNALHRLLLIEAVAIGAVLVVLSGGAWLVLRAGLRPLERMASTARKISAGDLTSRIDRVTDRTEVGQLGQALNTMLDDIEKAFAERDATEERLRQFLADASHELRTPLTSIQGFAELFRVSGDQARVDLPTILRRIEEEAARMRVLVEDLLLLARLDEHRPVSRQPVDLSVVCADACTDAVATDPARPVTLDAGDPVMVMADDSQMRQAVGNLVNNALRHTPAGSPLEVGCRAEGTTAVVTVRDHGAGLDDDSLTHVFDRFWQGDKARVGTGAGLGLSIVAAIAAEHDGRVTASNAQGGGALFTLEVPAVSADACARTPSPLPS